MSIEKNKSELLVKGREKVMELENALINIADEDNIVTTQDTKCFPLKHSFADGIYISHISVATEDVLEDYISPCYVIATPGTKRIIHANEDSIFVNIHKNPSNTENIQELEGELVSRNYEEYEKYINKK